MAGIARIALGLCRGGSLLTLMPPTASALPSLPGPSESSLSPLPSRVLSCDAPSHASRPAQVLDGFTLGAVWLVFTTQFPHVMGLAPPSGMHYVQAALWILLHPLQWDLGALWVALVTVVCLQGGKKISPLFPGALVALALGAGGTRGAWDRLRSGARRLDKADARGLSLPQAARRHTLGCRSGKQLGQSRLGFLRFWIRVSCRGARPPSWSSLRLPLQLQRLRRAQALRNASQTKQVRAVEAIQTCYVITCPDTGHHVPCAGDTWDPNKELVSSGIANLCVGLFGGFAVGEIAPLALI